MRLASIIRRGKCRRLLQAQQLLRCNGLRISTPFGGHNGSAVRHSTTESATAASSPSLRALRYPEPPSTEHNDLASYAAYAARTGLNTASQTYVGTQYEYTVGVALRRLGFDLRRVGGRADCGIDLLGTWAVPPPSTSGKTGRKKRKPRHEDPPLRILLQCKAAASPGTRIGPQYIRELEGAFAGAPVGWRGTGAGTGVLGILVTQRPATKGIREALGRSHWPMAYVSCTGDGHIQQMLWNRRAEEEGLEGLGIGVRYFEEAEARGGEQSQELILTWQGKPFVYDAQDTSIVTEPEGTVEETSSA